MNKSPNAYTNSVDTATVQKSLFELISSIYRTAYRSIPVPQPEIDSNLTELPILERIVEVFRYKILTLEYALSSGGGLRTYLKLNLLTSLLLGIPAIFVVPVITSILGAFATWSAYLFQTALNILFTLLTIVAIVAVIWLVIYFIRRHR
jgi:hypothetical protein